MNRPTPVEFDGETLGDEELERIADLMTAVNAQWAPADPPVSVEWARADLLRGNELFEIRRLLVEQAGRVVGLASIDLEQAEANRHIAELYIDVHPDFLRRGVGTALTAAAVRIAREEGRTSLAPWGPNTEASHAFWGRLDLPEVLADRDSRVTVADIDADLMHRWRTRSRARELGYELRSWVSPCPDEFMPLYVATQLGMNDAPLDDLDMAHPDIDEAWNRARERRNARRNAVIRVIAAVSPDGEPAGMTEVIVSSHRPWYVLQQGTTTLAAHRGQGLGRWLKAEMYYQLREHHPEAQIIETGNAASNAPMLAINNEMGFRVHVPHTIRQADVDVVAAALERLGSLDPAES